MIITRFLIYYVLYTALLAGIAIALPHIFPELTLIADKFWVVFGFLGGLTCIATITALIGIKSNPEKGVIAILASIALKMLFSMAFVLIYSINQEERGIVFALNFFSLYLLFTGFEIYSLLRNLRHQNLK